MSHSSQLLLELNDGSPKSSGIESSIETSEPFFAVRRDTLMDEEPLIWCLRLVVGLGDLAAVASFGFEFHHRLKEVCKEPE